MQIGRKDRRVAFDKPTDSADTFGDALITYTEQATVWASVEPLRGTEAFETQQVRADVTHRIRIRYSAALAGISPKWRARMGSTVFDLVSVLDINTGHRELELLATEHLQ